MNVNILRIGRIVSKYFDIVRYIIDNNHEQDVKEYKLLGLYKFLHFQDFCHNLFSIMNTNKTTKPVLNKKITMEVLGMEQFLGSQSSEDDVKIMDKKFAPLRRDHPQLDFNSDMRSTYNLKMFSFYKIAFFNFYPIVNEFMKIYYDFSEILTGGKNNEIRLQL